MLRSDNGMPDQFAAPPKHRIDTVLWWLIRSRMTVMALALGLTALLMVTAVTCAQALPQHGRSLTIPIAVVLYFIDLQLQELLIHSWRRRVAWQAYWDHVYRDGDIIRSKP